MIRPGPLAVPPDQAAESKPKPFKSNHFAPLEFDLLTRQTTAIRPVAVRHNGRIYINAYDGANAMLRGVQAMRTKMLYLSQSARKPPGGSELQARIAVRPGMQPRTLPGLRYETSVSGLRQRTDWFESPAAKSDCRGGLNLSNRLRMVRAGVLFTQPEFQPAPAWEF